MDISAGEQHERCMNDEKNWCWLVRKCITVRKIKTDSGRYELCMHTETDSSRQLIPISDKLEEIKNSTTGVKVYGKF